MVHSRAVPVGEKCDPHDGDERAVSWQPDDTGTRQAIRVRRSDSPWRDDAHAVVIGINAYEDPRIPDLRFARSDAEAVYRVLTDPTVGRFNPANVTLLVDEQATERRIRSALGTKLPQRASKTSTVCIYYAGHGAPVVELDAQPRSADSIEKYLVPHDAIADDLRSSAISMDAVQQYFSWLDAKQVIFFIDSCYSGAAGGRTFERDSFQIRAMLSDEFLDALASEGRVVITACATREVALESPDVGHGLFTYHLVRGLQGRADTDGDGRVSIDELYDYVYVRVVRDSRLLQGRMNPVRKGTVRGRVYLTEYRRSSDPVDDSTSASTIRRVLPALEMASRRVTNLGLPTWRVLAAMVFLGLLLAVIGLSMWRMSKSGVREKRTIGATTRLENSTVPVPSSPAPTAVNNDRGTQLPDSPSRSQSPEPRQSLPGPIPGQQVPATERGAGTPAARGVTRAPATSEAPIARSSSARSAPLPPSIGDRSPTTETVHGETNAETGGGASVNSSERLSAPPPARTSANAFRPGRWNLPDTDVLGFVEIPAGTFLMGSDPVRDRDALKDELPQHSIMLPAFMIGRYEVTIAQFLACVDAGGCRRPELASANESEWLPVRFVSWKDATAYCEWLEKQLRGWSGTPATIAAALRGARDGREWHVRLPTEAEWEKAARGAEGRIYPWGDAPIDAARANYDGARIGQPAPVGRFPTGTAQYGLFDLSGNVWEWTHSRYVKYPYRAADGREDERSSKYLFRVIRGGSFQTEDGRAAQRNSRSPDDRTNFIGFRVAIGPPLASP